MQQVFIDGSQLEEQLTQILQKHIRHRLMLVAGKSFFGLSIRERIYRVTDQQHVDVIPFSEYTPNPSYDQVAAGVERYREKQCEGILAVGGGSAIDVAKCIKLFSTMRPEPSCLDSKPSCPRSEPSCQESEFSYLEQEIPENSTLLAVVPTTAGSGSESTQFAVIYKDGEKKSVDSKYALPQYVILDASSLQALPVSGKRSCAADALSHAIESYWSMNATDQSKAIARKAMKLLLTNMDAYWQNDPDACRKILEGANLAGQAINRTRTTAAHAMCYKFTSLFGVPHGHAVMLCLPEVWQYMQEHLKDCRDVRGKAYLAATLEELAHCLGKKTPADAIDFLKKWRRQMEFAVPEGVMDEQIERMSNSVNVERLQNFPVVISQRQIGELYRIIIRG